MFSANKSMDASNFPTIIFIPIPDPGVKKAPDPGSATLVISVYLLVFDTLEVSPEELVRSEVVSATLCLPDPVIDGLQIHRIIAQLKATHLKPALLIRIRDPVPF